MPGFRGDTGGLAGGRRSLAVTLARPGGQMLGRAGAVATATPGLGTSKGA